MNASSTICNLLTQLHIHNFSELMYVHTYIDPMIEGKGLHLPLFIPQSLFVNTPSPNSKERFNNIIKKLMFKNFKIKQLIKVHKFGLWPNH